MRWRPLWLKPRHNEGFGVAGSFAPLARLAKLGWVRRAGSHMHRFLCGNLLQTIRHPATTARLQQAPPRWAGNHRCALPLLS